MPHPANDVLGALFGGGVSAEITHFRGIAAKRLPSMSSKTHSVPAMPVEICRVHRSYRPITCRGYPRRWRCSLYVTRDSPNMSRGLYRIPRTEQIDCSTLVLLR